MQLKKERVAMASVRLKIRLIWVYCADPEDLIGGDEFFVSGGLILGGEGGVIPPPKQRRVGVALTPVINIGAGQSAYFNDSLGGVTVFDGVVDDSQTVTLSITAFDADTASDWDAVYRPLLEGIWGALSLGSLGPPPFNGIIKGIAFGVARRILQVIDPDDELGVLAYEQVRVRDLPTGGLDWEFSGNESSFSKWDYLVHYEISRTPAPEEPPCP
ncbi:hypothetical protein ABZ769_36800 [Streptomyces olivoreticuli]